jgi:hypothetical protein
MQAALSMAFVVLLFTSCSSSPPLVAPQHPEPMVPESGEPEAAPSPLDDIEAEPSSVKSTPHAESPPVVWSGSFRASTEDTKETEKDADSTSVVAIVEVILMDGGEASVQVRWNVSHLAKYYGKQLSSLGSIYNQSKSHTWQGTWKKTENHMTLDVALADVTCKGGGKDYCDAAEPDTESLLVKCKKKKVKAFDAHSKPGAKGTLLSAWVCSVKDDTYEEAFTPWMFGMDHEIRFMSVSSGGKTKTERYEFF